MGEKHRRKTLISLSQPIGCDFAPKGSTEIARTRNNSCRAAHSAPVSMPAKTHCGMQKRILKLWTPEKVRVIYDANLKKNNNQQMFSVISFLLVTEVPCFNKYFYAKIKNIF